MNGKIGRQVFFDQVKGGKATGKPHKRLKVIGAGNKVPGGSI